MSSPKTYSTNTMKKWAGPNADKVRGELKTWHTKCTSVAKALRDKATEYDNEATKATNKSDK
ncbi:hypothetical protein [Streptomyces sp. NPDC018031]|uniref:hypothetical protein n=1 Tax=Streptomyces sp. NPDC018031 TaxID=3365033 RepID=UPI0037BB9936